MAAESSGGLESQPSGAGATPRSRHQIVGNGEKRAQRTSLQPRHMDRVPCRPHRSWQHCGSYKALGRSGLGGHMKTSTRSSRRSGPRKAEVLRNGWSAPGKRKSRLAARFSDHPDCALAIGFAVFVRLQPPTVIRIGPNGDALCAWQARKGRCHRSCHRRDRSSSWMKRL